MTTFRRILSLASATALAAAVFLSPRPASATNYAVCVGVNTYNSSYCSNPLNGCVPDAQHMTNLITARGEWTAGNVSFLSNSGATLTKIRQAVSNVAKKAVSGDKFLYYHSSHGGNDVYYFTTSGGKQYLHYGLDSTGVSNYICSYNADYTAKMMATDLAAFPSGVKIVVMMDTCHSAGMFKYNATTSSRKALSAKLAEAQAAAADDGSDVEEPAPENSVSGFFMEAVLDQLAQVEEDQVRRGLRPRSAKSLATDVGWIAAADYDQYSWDGDNGGAFTEAFINGVTNQNKMCDNATYGNQDGYASFYEGWNYAKDIARGQRDYSAWDYDSNAGYYDYIWTDAQCTNTAVLDSVLVGWAGKTAPNVKPSFSPSSISTNVVQNGELEYTFSAAGTPTPTYTLSTSVSSSLYDFDNGYLYFQPTATGTYTFTCTASNSAGTATCTLTVAVTLPPPETPSEVTQVGSDSFTATWTAVSGASTYQLVVIEGSAGGGSGSGPFTLVTSSSGLTAGEYVILADGIDRAMNNSFTTSYLSYEDVTVDNSTVSTDDASIIWTLAGNAASCTLFNADAEKYVNPATSKTVGWSSDASGSWTLSLNNGLVTAANAADSTWMLQYNSGSPRFTCYNSAQKKLRFFRRDARRALPRAVGDVVYSNSVGNVTNFAVPNLQPNTTYSYSVRAIVNGEPTPWSDSVSVTTTEGDAAPAWSAIPAQTYRYGSNTGVFEFNVASYASGFPAPAFYLGETALTAYVDDATGDFVFEPAALGTFSFTVIASNSVDTASTTLSVTVDAIAPELAAIGDRSGTLGSDVEFTVSATGDPAPTFEVASDDAEAVVIDQDGANYFFFTPSATGTYQFTVTASNIAGSDSETFTVTVSDAPVTVPTLLVDATSDTTAYALWDACTGVTSYTLQLASDDQFTTGGGSGGGESVELVKEGFDNGTTLPTGWTVESGSISGTYTSSGNYGSTSPSLQFKNSVTLSTPTLSNPTNVSFWCKGQGSGLTSTLEIQQLLGGTWTNVDTLTIPGTGTTFSYSLNSSSTQVRFIFTKASGNLSFDDVVITGTSGSSGSSTGSLISSTTVNDTEYTFTGLTPETTYYARVKGNADWSNVEEFTTLAGADSAPVWSAIPAQNYLFGSNNGTFEFNVAPYASGSPAPAFYLDDTPWTAYVDDGTGDFIFEPDALGTFDFTVIASNTQGTADATLSVVATAAPPAFVDLPATVTGYAGEDVAFTVVASGNPAPVLGVDAADGLLFTFNNSTGEFMFNSDNTGDFEFEFTAANIAATVTQTVTVTVSPAPVTVPTLSVTEITTTSALASWTACDGVSTYTLQLTDDAFPAASSSARSLTPILSEDFSGFTPTSNTDIGSNNTLNNYTTNSGWTGIKVYPEDQQAKIGAGSAQGWLMTPALTVSGSLTVVWEARRYGTGDKNTLLLGISEDGTTFTDTTVTLYDDMTGYTNTFEVVGTNAYVRWMSSSSSKGRFYLDNVRVTTPESGGGDDPGGDSVQTFTVTGTSYTFTDLTPDTAYLARVKGNAGWSEEVIFQTLGTSDTAPAIDPIADQTYTYGDNNGIFTLAVTASGTPAPTFSVASSDAPEGSFDIGQNDGEFLFEPAAVGTFHFTVTAANGVSPNATASFAVTVTGTAPTLAAIADQTVAVEEGQLTVPLTVTGNPAPTVTVASADAPDDSFCIDSNGDFYFLFDDATGTFHFTITAANGVSPNATQSFTVTVTGGDTPVEPLEIVFDDFSATASSFTVQGATAGHTYNFLWTTDLLVPGFTTNTVVATNTTFTVDFPNDGTWFGYVQPAAP